MTTEQGGLATQVKKWRLEKRNAAGELFEVIEGGDGQPTRVLLRKPGEAPESYASVEEVEDGHN